MTDKRPAFESPARLLAPTGYNPSMKRPLGTTFGAALVLLRVAAGVLWLAALAFDWPRVAREVDVAIEGVSFAPGDVTASLVVVLTFGSAVLLLDGLLAVLIYRGVNWARVLVMLVSVGSISSTFVAWWVQGQDIEIQTTLITLSLDILVLLALSSRDAAAYARRNERR